MYKDKIIDFAKKQIITVPIKEVSEGDIKYERRHGDLSKWFSENDTIEFDDSAEAFMSVKNNGNLLETLKTLKVKVYVEGKEADLKKESFHCASNIGKCIMSFFSLGE